MLKVVRPCAVQMQMCLGYFICQRRPRRGARGRSGPPVMPPAAAAPAREAERALGAVPRKTVPG